MSEPSAAEVPWRVVVLDDSADDRAVVRHLLRGCGQHFFLEEADTAAAGLELIASGKRPHCVLLDYYLPDAQAAEVLSALTGDDGMPRCPIVVLTGLDSTEASRELLRAGAQDFIGKDWLSPAVLVRTIENAFERWNLSLRLREREARLREREQELELAFEAAKLLYFSWDIPADRVERRMSCLPSLPSTDSTQPGPVRFREVVAVVHPEDRPRFEADVKAALEGDGHYASAFRIAAPAGEIWLEERGRVRFNEHNQPVRLAGVSVDTTARRQAEAQQAKVAEQQRLLLDVARMVLEAPAADADLSRRVYAQLVQHFEADILLHYQVDEHGLRLLAGEGIPESLAAAAQRLSRDQAAFCGVVAVTGEPLAADAARIDGDPAGAFLRQLGVHAYACHPLFDRNGHVLGTFSVGSRRRSAFTSFEVHTLETVCHFLALAWDRQRADDKARAHTQQLQRNHDTFYHLIENNPFGLFVVDSRFRLRQASEGTQRSFGGLQSLLGRDFSEVLRVVWSEPNLAEIEQHFRRTLETGASHRAQQTLQRRADIAPETFDWRIERIELPDGDFGVVCYYYDLSDRQRLEAQLLVRERELQTLADNSPDILVRFDTQLRHVFVNRALERATGKTSAHFLGKTCAQSYRDPELCARLSAGLARVIARGRPEQMEFALDGPAGTRSYASTLLPELDGAGRVASILGVTHDITDQKRMEQVLQETDRRKDEFLATLAHELRNPLAPLRTGLNVIQQDAATEDTRARACAVMDRQLGHMVRLVDDLLDLSRISRGKIELQRIPLAVSAVIDQALEISQPLVDAGNHTLCRTLPDDELWIAGDLTRLSQVVSNLVNNAAKYTPEGGRLGVTAARCGEAVEITVTDTGTGIAADNLPYVFDLFTQSENTRARAQGGLGIGLSLVKRLVEMHGGSVSAASEGLGRGSTFCVRLPVVAAPSSGDRVQAAAPRGRADRNASAPSRRVLVVDDNEDAAEMLATTLQLRGYMTATAFSGPEAIATALVFDPDVVLLDIGLPDMDGHEVARAFRGDARLSRATLVALTGWGSDKDKQKSREAGFEHHLVKPADVQAVQEILTGAHGRPRESSSA